MELCVLARVLKLIEKYLRTRTCIVQEILGPDSTRLQNARSGKLKQKNSAREITSFANFNKNRPVHHKSTRIDFVSFSDFSSGNYDVVLYACVICFWENVVLTRFNPALNFYVRFGSPWLKLKLSCFSMCLMNKIKDIDLC